VQLLGGAGVPASEVSAVLVDVTVSSTTAAGTTNVKVWASDQVRPTFSVLQVSVGSAPATTTMAVIPGSDGKINVFNSSGTTAVNIDVQGYFSAPAGSGPVAGGFVAMSPARLADTRDGTGVVQGEIGANQSVTLQVTGGLVPAGASAVFASVGVRAAEQDGSLRIIPSSEDPASAKPFMNYSSDVGPQAMGGALRLGSSGAVTIFNAGASPIDVTIDVEGIFGGGVVAGGGFTPTPLSNLGTYTLAAGAKQDVSVGGQLGVPLEGAGGVMLSLRAKDAQGSGNGFLYAYRTGAAAPTVSTLQWTAGATANNGTTAVIAPGDSGQITLRNDANGEVTIVVQLQGWFSAAEVIAT
jgi:hypothetical protein